tara:strand:- start:419 stop:529 length:111 start_codon:yes stop_codon:yes gene_type:complete
MKVVPGWYVLRKRINISFVDFRTDANTDHGIGTIVE